MFKKRDYVGEDGKPRVVKVVKIAFSVLGGLLLLALLVLNFPLGTVGAGERGIKLRFGAVVGEALEEGLYFRVPLVEKVKKMDIKVQKITADADAASKDLQVVTSQVAINYHLDSVKVTKIYQEVGIDYSERLISPAVQESVKATTANYTAEELITKRSLVKEDIKKSLQERLTKNGIIIDEFNITNFDFSKSFNEAIELKVTAEQQALASKNKLEQTKYEAQQGIETAKGKAEAIKIESQALRDNPQVLELRSIEKWDGKLPNAVNGGALPFINIVP